jgi:carbon storage regulator
MLVLSRRLNEKLLIPCIETAVQVVSIQGTQVRLGVDAPPHVAVFREEIYDAHGSGRGANVSPDRLPGLVRNRLAKLGLDLDRLHRQSGERLDPAARDRLAQLGGEFVELACLVDRLLQEAGATAKPVAPNPLLVGEGT